MTTTPVEEPLATVPPESAPEQARVVSDGPAPATPEQREKVGKIVSEARAVETASWEELMGKPKRVLSFTITLPNKDGEAVVRRIRYQALEPDEYDALVALHPPTQTHKEKGLVWNEDTFPPAIIAAVSHAPKMDEDQAKALYRNKAYSAGERRELFYQALEVCGAGLNVPFNASV